MTCSGASVSGRDKKVTDNRPALILPHGHVSLFMQHIYTDVRVQEDKFVSGTDLVEKKLPRQSGVTLIC